MAPRQKQTGGGGKKKENNKATTSNQDDECSDMPPLEDMRKVESTTGEVKGKGDRGGKEGKEKKAGKEEVKLPEVRWSEGETPLGVAFATKDVREAYRTLNIDSELSDEGLLPILHDKLTHLFVGIETKDSYEAVGSALLIACSRTVTVNSTLFPIVQKVYTYEANHHLAKLKLPIIKNQPKFDRPGLIAIMSEESTSRSSIDAIKRSHSRSRKDSARLDAAEKEAKESKGELEKMKIELVDYKAEVKEGYKARDEKASELEKVKNEKEDVRSELEKRDLENAKLKEENARLRVSSTSPTSSQAASSDKTSFVIKSLSRQVRDLGRQVKEKNDQLAEMMVEMSKGGFE